MKYYHGAGRRGPYFEGWYLKCQTRDGRALALIPAVHQDRTGRRSASLQVLAEDGAWWLEDLGSTNGTMMDGRPVHGAVELPMNIPVRIGQTTLELRS